MKKLFSLVISAVINLFVFQTAWAGPSQITSSEFNSIIEETQALEKELGEKMQVSAGVEVEKLEKKPSLDGEDAEFFHDESNENVAVYSHGLPLRRYKGKSLSEKKQMKIISKEVREALVAE